MDSFVQFACALPNDRMRKRWLDALFIVCLGSFGMMMFILTIVRFRKYQEILDYECHSFEAYIQEYVMEIKFSDKQIANFEENLKTGPDADSYGV